MARLSTRPATDFTLPGTHWRQFRDVRCAQAPSSVVDHVVVGPSGVTVISYHQAAAVDELLPHHRAREAADLVRAALPHRYRGTVHAVLCILDDSPVAETLDGVLVTSLAAVEQIVRGSPLQLSTSEVAAVHQRLQAHLEPAPTRRQPQRAGRRVLGRALEVVRRVTVLFLPFRGRRVTQRIR